jgi:hypothetical protein
VVVNIPCFFLPLHMGKFSVANIVYSQKCSHVPLKSKDHCLSGRLLIHYIPNPCPLSPGSTHSHNKYSCAENKHNLPSGRLQVRVYVYLAYIVYLKWIGFVIKSLVLGWFHYLSHPQPPI